ncbi:MAG: Hint domain-containing protein [Pseudodonghicola sp.]
MLKLLRELVSTDDQPEEVDGSLDGILITGLAGLVAGTRVATERGWRAVESLRVGDRVLSFDRGFQPLVDVQRDRVTMAERRRPGAQRPVRVPPGALGNTMPVWLMPDQGLLLESDTAQQILGEAFVVVPARALSGFARIAEAEAGPELDVVTLVFPRDEAVYVEGGLLAVCPRPQTPLEDSDAATEADGGYFAVQTLQTARYLVRAQLAGEAPQALGYAPEDLPLLIEAAPQPRRLAG